MNFVIVGGHIGSSERSRRPRLARGWEEGPGFLKDNIRSGLMTVDIMVHTRFDQMRKNL